MFSLQRQSIYLVLLGTVLLAGAGLVMLASTGAYATDGTAEGYAGLKKQIVHVGLGVMVCAAAALLDYRAWERWQWPVLLVASVLLALCFVPAVRLVLNGEGRWINARCVGLPALRFQPSEIGKIALLVFLAGWYARMPLRVPTFRWGFLLPMAIAGVPILLIGCEKDLGTAALLAAVVIGVMFVAGVRLCYLACLGALAGGGLVAAVAMIPERLGRWVAFTDLYAHRMGEGHQQWRALIALGSGGLTGRGAGNGIEKMFYMPYAHTDFIFPMIGEEFGLVGTLLVILCFVSLLLGGMAVAASAPDPFGRLLASGIVLLIGLQAVVNIGVTTAVLPNKGLPLPFISYGGSSVVVFSFLLGILVNIYRQGLQGRSLGRGLPEGILQLAPRI